MKLGNLSTKLCSAPLKISTFFNNPLLKRFLGNYLLKTYRINYSGLCNKYSEYLTDLK